MSLTSLLLFGLIAGLANLFGGLLVLPTKVFPHPQRNLKYMIALGIGFMLAVVFIEILPKSLAMWQELKEFETLTQQHNHDHKHAHGHEVFGIPMLLFLSGYLLIYAFEQIAVPHFHLDESDDARNLIPSSVVYAAFGGLLLHTFFDGVSLAAAATRDFHAGLLVFSAIFLHKVPEGFTVASLFVAKGKSARFAALMSGLAGIFTFLGVIGVLIISSWISFITVYILPFAAGVTLYVAGTELLPELKHREGNSAKIALTVCGGVALFFALHKILENFIEH